MPDNIETPRRTALGEPVLDPLPNDPLVNRPEVRETRSGSWLPAILGVLVVLGILFYLIPWGPHPDKTASNTNTITTTTEKVVPPATPTKPATQPTQTQPAPQPQ